ncbi:hypothetical protein KDA00_01190 [Candidatus Saccharibacteria bacterium]|nr:hypothetical protein [Candidatus Saccharibacteria bacterium]
MAVKKKRKASSETDSAYFFKIVMYLILGSQWIRLVNPELTSQIPIPIGFVIGMFFAAHDHFKIDRKIEYATLTIAMFIGFWIQAGIYITALQ